MKKCLDHCLWQSSAHPVHFQIFDILLRSETRALVMRVKSKIGAKFAYSLPLQNRGGLVKMPVRIFHATPRF